MLGGQKTFTLSEKFSNLENQEKFSGFFLNLDKSGKLFKSENMVNKRDMTEEFSKLEEDKPKKHLHFIQNTHNTST